MKLNHLDLPVRDIPANVAFLQRHFGLRLESQKPSSALAILTDGHGFVLVLQRREGPGEPYRNGLHFGFLVDDADAVRELQARARADGAAVSDVIVNGRGTMIYFDAPDGYRVEVAHQRVRFDGPQSGEG
jgi:catechol 2,3-dioxygenase-like lactoylglutathione lyase family enzyme